MTDKLEAQLRTLVPHIELTRISQGAEAIVYRSPVHPYLPSGPSAAVQALATSPSSSGSYIVKYRPPKPYRHPTLDASLTKHRTLAEARLLVKLNNLGVSVPRLVGGDFRQGVIWMEDVGTQPKDSTTTEEQEEHDSGSNGSVKVWIWGQEGKKAAGSIDTDEDMKAVLLRIGAEIGKLHLYDVVHGDLTTSNIILRPSSDASGVEPVLIDFGLGSQSTLPEDKAVDLYVLERAVNSTHPVHSDIYNAWLLEGYTKFFESSEEGKKLGGGGKKIRDILRKLEDVRMRGRKRSMEG